MGAVRGRYISPFGRLALAAAEVTARIGRRACLSAVTDATGAPPPPDDPVPG